MCSPFENIPRACLVKLPRNGRVAGRPGALQARGPRSAIARQRSEIVSEPSIGRCLRPLFKEISTFSSCKKIYSSILLRIRDVGSPELLGKLSLIPLLCSLRFSSRSDVKILSTSHLKIRVAINMFNHNGRAFDPPPLLLYELSCSNGSSKALRVMCEIHCASAQRNCF